ncbi:uncharacterized protein LOC110712561 [Chenopodium quinoa]|uniref:uncharacterized protein LOC110712561 n=1 Tax=Chenopodium quinoa TaxID=63459 RepID=UPI000B78FE65|nr:uncharacterized protein LOC110712561 [Chenopodium quinoa]
MGHFICCQGCGAVIKSGSLVKESTKRKICWKFCKIVLKNVVAELIKEDWNHKDTAMYYRGRQGQVKGQLMANNVPNLCRTCINKSEVEVEVEAEAEEAAAAAATKREAKAALVVAARKRKAEDMAVAAAAAAATAKREAETRAYCLMLMVGCFICVSVSVGVCTWCFMRG